MDKYVPMLAVMFVFLASFSAAANLTSVTVYKDSPFGITNLVQSPDKIYPGDSAKLQFTVTDVDAARNNAALNVLIPFGSVRTTYSIGSMSVGEAKEITVNFNVPSTTKPGTYDAYIYATIDGANYQVGTIPLTVNSADLSNAVIASVTTDDLVVAGTDTEMTVTLHNVAGFSTDDVLVQIGGSINSSDETSEYLLPLSSDRVYIDSIKAGEEAKVYFNLAVSASAGPGYYPITLTTTYSVDKAVQAKITQTFALKVSAPASLLVTAEDPVTMASNSSASIDFTIANSGGVAVRAVYAKAIADNFTFSTDSEYVGTLNLDDTATVSITASPKGQLTAGTYPLTLNVTYKDAANVERYQLKTVNVQYTGRSSLTAFGSGTIPTRTKSNTIFGFDYLTIGVALVVLAAAGFLGYRYYNGRRKAQAAGKALTAAAEGRKK